MKITDQRIKKPTKFGDLKPGDIFESIATKNICMKILHDYGNFNAFIISDNPRTVCRFCGNDEVELLDTELIIK